MEFILRRVVESLPRFSYRFSSEVQLHQGIAEVLKQEGLQFAHEVVAGPHARFDFLVEPGIVIEAKINGSFSKALSQVGRYAALANVNAVVLVTTRFWGGQERDVDLYGKPVRFVRLRGSAF